MHRFIVALSVPILVVVSSAGAAPKLRERTKPLAENILGEWNVTTRFDELRETKDGATIWKVGSDKLSSDMGGVESIWEMSLDEKTSPNAITLTRNGSSLMGIVTIDGDIMKVCYRHQSSGERPTKFEATDGAFLVVLKRMKNR